MAAFFTPPAMKSTQNIFAPGISGQRIGLPMGNPWLGLRLAGLFPSFLLPSRVSLASPYVNPRLTCTLSRRTLSTFSGT